MLGVRTAINTATNCLPILKFSILFKKKYFRFTVYKSIGRFKKSSKKQNISLENNKNNIGKK